MIALLNTYPKIITETVFNQEARKNFNLSKVFKLSFDDPIHTADILNFIKNPKNAIRFATNKEIFSMLSRRFPLQDGEVVVCLESDIEIGDDLLVIRQDGPAIIPAFSLWDTRYSFPVVIS